VKREQRNVRDALPGKDQGKTGASYNCLIQRVDKTRQLAVNVCKKLGFFSVHPSAMYTQRCCIVKVKAPASSASSARGDLVSMHSVSLALGLYLVAVSGGYSRDSRELGKFRQDVP